MLYLWEPWATIAQRQLPKHMQNTLRFLGLLILFLHPLAVKSQEKGLAYNSEHLKIIAISENSYVHVSYLDIPDYGRFQCNGLIYINDKEAVVFDSPAEEEVAKELIKWIAEVKNSDVTAVVVNHFHDDCLGGLPSFHALGIPSFANQTTIILAREAGLPVPQVGFDTQMELEVGTGKVRNQYFGEAHTKDNIVSYIAEDRLLFGGCMVKALDAKKGNLADANVQTWSQTVLKIKAAFPELQTVIPGHGPHGTVKLLDYTIALFAPPK